MIWQLVVLNVVVGFGSGGVRQQGLTVDLRGSVSWVLLDVECSSGPYRQRADWAGLVLPVDVSDESGLDGQKLSG